MIIDSCVGLQGILLFLIRQLRGLDNAKDPLYPRFYYLAEVCACVLFFGSLILHYIPKGADGKGGTPSLPFEVRAAPGGENF